jgi:histidine triad (HIT) family protein
MALTEEEAKSIKENLLNQLSNFPEDKREQIQEQVNSMSTNQVENFIQQNQLTHLGGQCIFCSIIAGKNPAIIIGENKENMAILEINPLSKGHALIVPKEHTKSINSSTKELGDEISKRITEKFNPNEIKTNEIEIMEHAILEIIPIYGDESEKKSATPEELQGIKEELEKPSEEIKILEEEIEEIEEPILKLPPRIP